MTLTNPTRWDEELPKVVNSYNHTMHSETGKSPAGLILTQCHADCDAPVAGQRIQQYWKEGHDQFQSFQKDDLVLLRKQYMGNLVTSKFKPVYAGPYKVIHVQPNGVTYTIQDNEQRKPVVRAHQRQLRPWKTPPLYLRDHPLFKELLTENPDMDQEEIEEPRLEDIPPPPPRIEVDIDEEDEEEFDFLGFDCVLPNDKYQQLMKLANRLLMTTAQMDLRLNSEGSTRITDFLLSDIDSDDFEGFPSAGLEQRDKTHPTHQVQNPLTFDLTCHTIPQNYTHQSPTPDGVGHSPQGSYIEDSLSYILDLSRDIAPLDISSSFKSGVLNTHVTSTPE